MAKSAVKLLLDNRLLEARHRYYAPTIEGWTPEEARTIERVSATPDPPAGDGYTCLRATDALREWLTATVKRAGETAPAAPTAGSGQDAAAAGGTQPEKPAAGKPPKMPPEKARQAYWTRMVVGDNQTDIARKMTENGVPANQGQVSRWLRAVDAYLAAGGIMPPLQTMHEQPQAMAPGTLDMGERQDGRTPRQRGKMLDPADDWD